MSYWLDPPAKQKAPTTKVVYRNGVVLTEAQARDLDRAVAREECDRYWDAARHEDEQRRLAKTVHRFRERDAATWTSITECGGRSADEWEITADPNRPECEACRAVRFEHELPRGA